MSKNEKGLFNFIAPIYGMFFKYQVNYYQKILNQKKDVLDIAKYSKIIDVGCGTGALSYVLHRAGFEVTGIDPALKMLKVAEKKLQNKGVNLVQANALERIPFDDKSFDLAIASYVVHGLKREERRIMYAEMSRVAKHLVIFHDYNEKRALHTDLAEWLEGGDYFNFIKNARSEMAESFKKVQIINVDTRSAWYICTPRGNICQRRRNLEG